MMFDKYMPAWKFEKAQQMRENPTRAERRVWGFLQWHKERWAFQVPMYGYIVDFYNPTMGLVLELDGKVHDCQKVWDEVKDMNLRDEGLKVVRLKNEQIDTVAGLHDLYALIIAALAEQVPADAEETALTEEVRAFIECHHAD